MRINYKVDMDNVTIRQWIRHKFPEITYERLQQSIRKGDIRVNGEKFPPQHILKTGDELGIWNKLTQQQETNTKVSPKYWQNIILVDRTPDFWVLDKPYGIPTQRGGNIQISLVEIMESWMETRAFIVHRLDRCTTGLIVIATNSYAARDLGFALKERAWHKTYRATVEGIVTKPGKIESPVDGKEAITKYKPVQTKDGLTTLELEPITGRKHQIRQHCANFLYPIVGDDRYGSTSKQKMQLRCTGLKFIFRNKPFEYKII
jgi:23S rRNA pseudouridine955/2504/2580 synthase